NSPYPLPENMARIHREVTNKCIPGHLCTGPIEVRGAKAGSALQVDILSVEADADWGYTTIRPQQGALPDDFDEINFAYSKIDRERRVATLPWGAELPLAPFFGLMTVAPPLG